MTGGGRMLAVLVAGTGLGLAACGGSSSKSSSSKSSSSKSSSSKSSSSKSSSSPRPAPPTGTAITGTTTQPAHVTATPPRTLQFGRSVRLRAVSGSVRVAPPASGGSFTTLTGTRLVPVGTTVDVRHGVVEVTTALPGGGGRDAGLFRQGTFKIAQSRSAGGLTDLTVLDHRTVASTCRGTGGRRRRSPSLLGLLLASARGGFRTDGEFAAATVRGTDWGVRNRCDGTLAVDREGVVVVTVYHPPRTITLHTGQTFLAKAS